MQSNRFANPASTDPDAFGQADNYKRSENETAPGGPAPFL
jgi:hypothetical protein